MERDDVAAAVAQLETLRADRAAIADRAMQPWWYDAALGLLVFAFLGSYSFGYPWVTVAVLPVFFAGLFVLKRTYERITGFWVSGLRPGRTRKLILLWFVFYGVVLALAAGAEFGLGWHGAMVVGGAVLGVGIALISHWWSRIYIAELREGL
ncbi:hypothetical protein [Geodermatophilus sp. URMC 64]